MLNQRVRDRREEAPVPAAPPDLVALQVFCRIVETGSFSEAAEACYLSQSAVSQRVRALERHYGRVLLERGRGRSGAEPTEAGQALYEGAREILDRVEIIETRLRELEGEVSGTIRLRSARAVNQMLRLEAGLQKRLDPIEFGLSTAFRLCCSGQAKACTPNLAPGTVLRCES